RGSRTAVAVRLLNTSAHPQTEVPLLVDVVGKDGKTLYTNATGGLEPSLQRIGVLEPGRQEWWVNDQVLTSQPAASVTVRAGTGGRGTTTGAVDAVGVSLSQQSGLPVLGGGLVNHAGASASKVPVYAVGLRGGRIVAGGRAVVETVPGHSSTPVPFQIFLVGDPTGASFQVTVAPAAG
ncbi:MAG TPA: hypothetical protein VKG62_06155, partial [Solirubrobacteraceae bacterium]|nr:hypothetical protein [Solirubrobacteraceae bacterium]